MTDFLLPVVREPWYYLPMTTIAPGLSAKPRAAVPSTRGRNANVVIDDDPTDYPDWEPVGRDPLESMVCDNFAPVLRRYEASRGHVCFVGSDNFIYGVKGDNKDICVSPDVYILPGVLPTARPQKYPGSKDQGCWKTWLLGIVPSFALEVKALKNPRKDELQSPHRHDGLGTKELIVFDPYLGRRRHQHRKRFCVYRRNDAGRLVMVLETNDMRVHSEQLDAFLVAERDPVPDGDDDDTPYLRLGLGPNGENLCPFESELVDIAAKRAGEAAKRADEEARLRCELAQRADEEAKRADEEARRANEALRRAAELEAEIARLRASVPKRRTKQK